MKISPLVGSTSNSGLHSQSACYDLLLRVPEWLLHVFCPGFIAASVAETEWVVLTPSYQELKVPETKQY